MSEAFTVGNLSAEKGTKVQGYLSVEGTPVELPVTIINGAKPGKRVLITGGTHGGEYPGVEASIRLAKGLLPEEVSGCVAVVHPVNVPAFFARLQYIGPYDGLNLNREYPGLATGTVTQRIAYTISSKLFTQIDFYMDLHGGDIHEALTPFVIYSTLGDDGRRDLSLAASKALGVKYVCGSTGTTGTFGCAATMGVPGFLGEIGNCGLWSEKEVGQYIDGVKNVLRLLGVIPGEAAGNESAVVMKPMTGVSAEQTGCWYPSVSTEERVKEGQKVGEIRDFFCNVLGEYFAPCGGIMLYVVSSLPVEKGDPLVAIGTPIDD
jgi:predicted deacylase